MLQAHWVIWPAEALVGQKFHALWEHVDEAGGDHDAAAEAARCGEGEAAGAQRLDAPTEQWQQHPCRPGTSDTSRFVAGGASEDAHGKPAGTVNGWAMAHTAYRSTGVAVERRTKC